MADPTLGPWTLHELSRLKSHHPAWRLIAADHSTFIISVLHHIFLRDHRRQVPENEMLRRLDDHLFQARTTPQGQDRFPRSAADYLATWTSDASGWLRATYPAGQDEPVYDLTAAAERAIDWVGSLSGRSFVGTESRLRTVVELLRQIRDGTQADPAHRLAELERRRAQLDEEIERARAGEVPLMNDAAIRDRFQLVSTTARTLLADLREVEQNFRQLDRATRTRVAQWDGGKGSLLDEVLGHRDSIAHSDQGRSFQAFWDFLMSAQRQEEFDELLEAVLALPAVQAMATDPRQRRMRDDWLQAGEHAQRTVARLSEQLRRFLDDRAALENRRIVQLIRDIERHAGHLSAAPPDGPCMGIETPTAEISLPMDRPLFTPPRTVRFSREPAVMGVSDADATALFSQHYVDPELLAGHVRQCLWEADAVPLTTVIDRHPLDEGLAELVGYLRLASADRVLVRAEIDESKRDIVSWFDGEDQRSADIPRVVFTR